MDEMLNDFERGIQKISAAIADFIRLCERLKVQLPETSKTNSIIFKDQDKPFIFTGQVTDLCYFRKSKTMPISAIQSITDDRLRNAVKDEFEKASANGLISIDNSTGVISVTDKGQEYINMQNFVRQSNEDQHRAFTNEMTKLKYGVENQNDISIFELNGTPSDLYYFNYAESLDQNELSQINPNKKMVDNVKSNFSKMEKDGLVKRTGSAVSATEKGYSRLKSSEFLRNNKVNVQKSLTKSSFSPNAVIAVTKAVLKAAQNTTLQSQQSQQSKTYKVRSL